MKKIIFSVIICISVIITYAQNETNLAPTGGSICSCTAPSTSSCISDCMFSGCCICWNPNTQTGACGCYWGVGTCRNENNSTTNSMHSSNFGTVSPDAKITFSFEKFSLLFDFFNSKNISPLLMENVFGSVKQNYLLTGKKVLIDNQDFARILVEYSKLIDKLNASQKEDLNIFIKSIK